MNELHLETITPTMQTVLSQLMDIPELADFRLVGGTALALQLGHRLSVDLDLFTDKTTDFEVFKTIFPNKFKNAMLISRSTNGCTWAIDGVKCDLFDWKVPFVNPPVIYENWRLASLEDIAAYKLESFPERKSEKDFRDIAEILRRLNFQQVITSFRKRYPFIQSSAVIPILMKSEVVVIDASIEMLTTYSLEQDAGHIAQSIKSYELEIAKSLQKQTDERE